MKRLLYTLVLLLPMQWVLAQTEFGLHYLPQVLQSQQTNPALLSPFKVNIALPSPYLSLANSGFTAKQILSPMPGSDSLLLNIDEVLARLGDQNYVRANVRTDILGVGIRVRNLQVTATAAARVNVIANYPRSLVDLAWNGNGAYLGEELEIAPDVAALAYSEIALGAAYRFMDRLTVGAKLKYLNGVANVGMEQRSIRFSTSPEYYQLQADVDMELRTSVLDFGALDSMEFSFEPEPFGNNRGWGLDLGATFEIGKRWDVSASVTDLGFINWTDEAKKYDVSGRVNFAGVDVASIVNGDSMAMETLVDSIFSGITIGESYETYRTRLPMQAMASVRFSPLKKLHLQGVVYNESYRGRNYPGLSVGVRKDFGKIFSLGASYNIRHRAYNQFGIQTWLRLGPFAGFLVMDNVLAPVFPMSAKYASIRLGLNLSIGKVRIDDKAPKDR
jgi:acylphosphatase